MPDDIETLLHHRHRRHRLLLPGPASVEVAADQQDQDQRSEEADRLGQQREGGADKADEDAADGRTSEVAEGPRRGECRLSLRKALTADQRCDRAEHGGIDEDACGADRKGRGQHDHQRWLAGKGPQWNHQRNEHLQRVRDPHHLLARVPIADHAGRQAEDDVREDRQREDQTGLRTGAAVVEHKPRQGDHRDAGTHHVERLRRE